MNEDAQKAVVGLLAVVVVIAIACGVSSCKKAALERVVGHPVGWWDYMLVTSK